MRLAMTLVHVAPGGAAAASVLSLGGLAFAALEGWPIWAYGLAAVLPWLPIFARSLAQVYRHYQWLALLYALVVTQTAHLLEHVAQMIQIHLLGLSGPDARGIFGALDIEWVHFVWNSWVLLAVLVLLGRFGRSRWLQLTLLLSGWHAVEHAYIFWVYLTTGLSGTPGLLAQGGALGGGLPITRPDLHFSYNLVETVPLVLAFLAQVRGTVPQTRSRRGPRPGFSTCASLGAPSWKP
jgi:hypothetical protein